MQTNHYKLKFGYLTYCLNFTFLLLFAVGAFAQPSKEDIPTQRLLLQLASCFLNVAKHNQIDIDSGLVLAAKRAHLNRFLVIGECFDDIIQDPANGWVATEDINIAKKIALSSSKSNQIRLLNLIGFFYAFQPAARKNDLDSALFYLTLAKKEAQIMGDINSFCQSLCGIGKCYLERGENLIAATSFKEAIDESVKSGLKEVEAMAWTFWGTYSLFQPETILQRIDHLTKANALYEQVNDKRKQIVTLTNIGYLNVPAGKMDASKQSILNALKLENDIGFPYTHYSIDMLSLIAFITDNHEGHLKYAMEEVKIVESNKDSIVLSYVYARRADADLAAIPSSITGIEWSKKALAEYVRFSDPAMYFTAYNLAGRLVNIGKANEAIQLVEALIKKYPPANPLDRQNLFFALGSAYAATNYSKAEQYYLNAVDIQKEVVSINMNNNIISNYVTIGQFYLKYHKYEKSRNFLNLALELPPVTTRMINIGFAYKYLSKVDFATGNLKDAYINLAKADSIFDQYNTITSNKQVDELRVKYETEKKDNNIKILNQQGALQQAQIKQDKFTKNVMIAGGVILMLFLGLLFNRFRLKQKSNQQLETQQKIITQKNTKLEKLLDEKEWLLKEVHHRVKNNLQIIISLLNNQSKYLKNVAAVDAIRESQQRLYAISLIHQKLYKAQDTSTINMQEYVFELVEHLKQGFNTVSRIKFELNILDVQLDVAQAVPLGLILNEAVSNAFKYAFTNDSPGRLSISFTHSQEENEFQLIVADNGSGLPPNYNISTTPSFGIRLMQGLSNQLQGRINIHNEKGLIIKLVFKDSNVINLMREHETENQLLKRIV